jgi:hypothetical protein
MSKPERHFGIQLSIEGLLLIVLEPIVVPPRFFQALSIGPTEDIVCEHSFAEACVPWEGIAQLDVLFSFFFDQLCVDPFVVLCCQRLAEFLVAREGKLVDLFPFGFDKGLHSSMGTSFTVIFVFGTPTISAAVL